jgi:hypothetical protein
MGGTDVLVEVEMNEAVFFGFRLSNVAIGDMSE